MKSNILHRVVLCLWVLVVTAGVASAQIGSTDAPVVRNLSVQGNIEISTERILEQVTRTKVGQPLERDNVQADVQSIAELGYFENVEAVPVQTVGGVNVVFVVKEFPVVREFTVTVAEDLVPGESVKALLDVEVGVILNAQRLTASLDELPLVAGEELGYVLRPQNIEFRGPQGDHLHIEVAPVRVGAIIIEGNEKTKDHVIRRELPIEEGDYLSMDDVRAGLIKLGQLGYFEPVIPEFLMTPDPLVVDILIPVVESKTGRAAFGGGYSSADGLIGYIEVADDNFLGRGEQVQVKWEFGKRKNTYDVGFYEPYLFGTTTSAGFNLYNTRNYVETLTDGPYTEFRTGGDITLGRPLSRFTRGFLTFKAENAAVEPGTDSKVDAADHKTRSVTAIARTDTTDHLFYPTTGFRHDISVEVAGHFFGGDTEFTKYRTTLSRFIKVGRNNQTLAFRAMAGYAVGTLPVPDQFRVGGAETVRGLLHGEARGDRMAVFQAEYRFPINDTIQGVVFLDAGNAWMQSPIDLGDLRTGYGIGVRFATPLGIMRIDYGIGERGGNTYFSFGPSF